MSEDIEVINKEPGVDIELKDGRRIVCPSWSHLGVLQERPGRSSRRFVSKCHFGYPELFLELKPGWETDDKISIWKEAYQRHFIGTAVKKMQEELCKDDGSYCSVAVGFGPPLSQWQKFVKKKFVDLVLGQLESFGFVPRSWMNFDLKELDYVAPSGAIKFSSYVRDVDEKLVGQPERILLND